MFSSDTTTVIVICALGAFVVASIAGIVCCCKCLRSCPGQSVQNAGGVVNQGKLTLTLLTLHKQLYLVKFLLTLAIKVPVTFVLAQ